MRWEKNDLVSLSLLAVLICAQGFSFHIESESKVTVQNNYVYISCHLVILTLHSLSFSFSLPPLHFLPLLSLSLSRLLPKGFEDGIVKLKMQVSLGHPITCFYCKLLLYLRYLGWFVGLSFLPFAGEKYEKFRPS